jgi:molybdopterin molybdotransferase
MDGFALRTTDVHPNAVWHISETILAGQVPTRRLEPGHASQIMTGAPIPPGADAVVPIERCTVMGTRLTLADACVPVAWNILAQGQELRRGQTVLTPGTVLTPARIGLLAAVGRSQVLVGRLPRVSVLSTGSEIVEPDQVPTGAQIRNSNGHMLWALAHQAGGLPTYAGIVPDERAILRERIDGALTQADVVVLSGGVSMGTHDLVPDVLTALGVEVLFHKVQLKPGKPLLFGRRGATLVFGLPGNPVSSFVGFALFVGPALRLWQGHPQPEPIELALPLTDAVHADHNRPAYVPAQRVATPTGPAVRVLPWLGSADLLGLCPADTLALFPPGTQTYLAGTPIHTLDLRNY